MFSVHSENSQKVVTYLVLFNLLELLEELIEKKTDTGFSSVSSKLDNTEIWEV